MRRNNVAVIAASALLFGTVAGTSMVGVNMLANKTGITGTADASGSSDAATSGSTDGAKTAGNDASESSNASGTVYDASKDNGGTIQLNHSDSSSAKTVSEVAKDAMPSVVSITNTILYQQYGYSIFGNGGTQEAAASGSGVIIGKNDTELLIVTNHHVVSDSNSLSVQFVDGTSADAEIKGEDSDADLAVIAVKLSDIPSSTMSAIKVAEFGDSDETEVGDQVVAIGNALGYGQSVTTGIISAKDRDVETEEGTESGLMQTDAAINPGNSGGALLNMEGQVIGINVAKYSSTDVEGMGYSIPSTKVKEIVNQLSTLETRSKVSEAERGYLGIQAKTVDAETSEAYAIPQGVYVYKVISGEAAEKAGIQEKDIITKFDGQTVTSYDDLTNLLARYAAGTTVTVTVQRPSGNAYEEKELSLTLGTNPNAQTTSDSGENNDSNSSAQQDPFEKKDNSQNSQNNYNYYSDNPFAQFFANQY
ncbi:MAG: trypsin-like peptidase domain-containing protein [Oribacterium sp.]|jgi:serine protease Do|nr:trypsin-like peptidase domain-containing protein [Oribacterium sp.]MDY6308530.1 trypsin-like peptidase domain-containing protein [Oribacterium sp.]MDY6317731.1 trypsin-like peptidase domain-containing protein [Oribacterium sp.]